LREGFKVKRDGQMVYREMNSCTRTAAVCRAVEFVSFERYQQLCGSIVMLDDLPAKGECGTS
jgi:hypothetical protein